MLLQSVRDGEVGAALPRTVTIPSRWDPAAAVPDEAYVALAATLRHYRAMRLGAPPAGSIESPGLRTLFLSAAKDETIAGAVDPKQALIAHNPRWGRGEIWLAIRSAAGPLTLRFLLSAFDLELRPDGTVTHRGGDRAIYRKIYLRTFSIAGVVTAICLVLALPLALYLAALSDATARRALLLVMLPLWTSVLVRAMAWILLLDRNGLVNTLFTASRLTAQPLTLVFNRFGVLITMVHVLLPFMVLPIYVALRGVPRSQLWAAGSLGAPPWVVLVRVYLPQARAGIAAGIVLVLASATGYYITPALVGGGSDEMLGSFVHQAAIRNNDPQLAAALGVVFLAIFTVVIAAVGLVVRPRILPSRTSAGA